jgi:transcriptional regulator with XRE-family HTH domain
MMMMNNMNNHWKVFVLILRDIAQQKNITQEEIANRAGLMQSNVSRFFSLKYCPTMEMFLKIAKALEVNFFFEDRESKTDLTLAFERAMEEMGRRANKLPKN